ncbi:Hypothetical protein PHPALM_2220 [Phytophthora palmivora]|uniref:Uncharacterized protein n=1 Tax=Phytophthora palmivora TaxID=4796 RepID=A0A2P4YQE3_9STRA|nr:Hypothetical protein PHPALM_2220 [Phytophthora palmivora]
MAQTDVMSFMVMMHWESLDTPSEIPGAPKFPGVARADRGQDDDKEDEFLTRTAAIQDFTDRVGLDSMPSPNH